MSGPINTGHTPYILLLEDKNGSVDRARGRDGKYVAAAEGNQYLLREMGDRLLEENLIDSYQIALLSGFPTRRIVTPVTL